MTNETEELRAAILLHQQGQLDKAAALYRGLITRNPANYEALHYLGTIEASFGRLNEARRLIERSLVPGSTNVPFLENYATILFQVADYTRGLEICENALKFDRANATFSYLKALSLYKLGRLPESLAQFEALLAVQPNHIAGHNERGSVLAEMQQYEAALTAVEKALSLDPRYAEGHLNRGNIYSALDRYDDALTAYDRALSLNPRLAADAWLGRGNALRGLKRHKDALEAYDKALQARPGFAAAWFGRGNLFKDLTQYEQALGAYDKALNLNSKLAAAWLGRGDALSRLMRYDIAAIAYDKALSLEPDLAEAWLALGNLFSEIKQPDKAFVAYDRAFNLKPELKYAEGARLYTKLLLCDWTNAEAEVSHLVSEVKAGRSVCSPFSFLAISSSPDEQLRCAKSFVASEPSFPAIWQGETYSHNRIRVAYLSADLHEHATAHLIAGLFEHHDRSNFEVTALSFGPDENSDMRRRLKAAVEHFIDVRDKSDGEIAELIRQLEIDIAVDLKGFTQDARFGVLARRAAPIQVSYIGYPGTMGTDYIDYIIADPTVIPREHFPFYSERIVWLPDSYQANDANRRIANETPTRRECGLPDSGFVFCCFNNTYKITPEIFDIWMRLLHANADSVLWLLEGHPATVANLRREAERRAISPDRLIFAKRLPLSSHLARHRHADLFLDTLPYNAHTTASDALWAGVPVLTRLGTTFAGRVAAGLLKAIGLDELITNSAEEYEALAMKLARTPQYLSSLRNRLVENRQTQPLFNTGQFARNLEAAYTTMWQRQKRGEPPDALALS